LKATAFSNTEIDELRATLEHTWLKRRLLYRLQMERTEWFTAASLSEPLPEVLSGIPYQIQEARKLLGSLLEVYSPARLIDKGPLAALPEKERCLIRDAVHKAYLEARVMQPFVERLAVALEEFESKAAEIPCAWVSGIDEGILSNVLIDLESAAKQLRTALLELPQEVILP
jgi:hypothetical protein